MKHFVSMQAPVYFLKNKYKPILVTFYVSKR